MRTPKILSFSIGLFLDVLSILVDDYPVEQDLEVNRYDLSHASVRAGITSHSNLA